MKYLHLCYQGRVRSSRLTPLAAGLSVWLLASFFLAATASAQSSSLYQRYLAARGQRNLTMEDTSLIFQAVEPPRKIQLYDLITVIVSEQSQTINEGELERRKISLYNAALADWILLDGFSARPDPQSEGDLRVNGQLNSQYRAEADMETADSMQFSIQAQVVDIRPNGLLVIEARKTIQHNAEVAERTLIGLVRPEDVLPDNSVLSRNVAELRIYKNEKGSVPNGYRLGWFARLFDTIQPF